MRISILQTDTTWEDKEDNLKRLRNKLEKLRGETDIVLLPEMFSTGFSMQSQALAEPVDGYTISTLQSWAKEYNIALAGSYIASNNGNYYNRGFFLTPDSEAFYYDKKHLFRMGREEECFSSGNSRIIIPYRGWNICLLICYDLRFPVWSRNVNNAYDLLIYVANWPTARRHAWDTLLAARAIENMAYVCGANRIGTDGYGLAYNGGSAIYSSKGKVIVKATDDKEDIITTDLNLNELHTFRDKFRVWMDADEFNMLNR